MTTVDSLELDGVLLLRPRKHGDDRGYFLETWRADRYAELGIDARFVQDNESFSRRKGTLRGLHFQAPPFAQAKLVRVVRGSIFDVAVDIRRASPTYGRWCGAVLTGDGAEQLFVPRGFAHGFVTLEDDVTVAYKVDSVYSRDHEGGLIWNDPDLAVDWRLPPGSIQAFGKDRELPAFAGFESPFA